MTKKRKALLITAIVIAVICLAAIIVKMAINNNAQKIGFPDDKINYYTSPYSLKSKLGDDYELENSPEDGTKTYIFNNINFQGIQGKCIFTYKYNIIINVYFESDENGYDEATAKAISEYVESFYKDKNGYKVGSVNRGNNKYVYTFDIISKNGATGKSMEVELNFWGKLKIRADNMF